MTPTPVAVPVSFDDAGHGEPALVYLTGWCSTRASYAAMTQHTARYRRSIAIDWRGHGTSPTATGDFGWPQLTDDVLAVLDACGVQTFVPVANAHAGWVARDLAARAPGRVRGVVLLNWLIVGDPAPFLAGVASLADPAVTRAAVGRLTSSWLDGHEDIPGLPEQIAAMRAHGDEMWARAGREIGAAYVAEPSPLEAFAALPTPPPVRHVYAEPKEPAFLAAQQEFASANPWFSVRRLEDACTHFPMLECPRELAEDVIEFTSSLAP